MEETVEAFDRPRYYHVGQDELKLAPRPPDVPNGRSRREKFKTALDLLKKNCDDLNVRMMMWSDQLLDSYNGGAPDHTSQLRSTLSREIILCDWNYFGTNGFSELKLLAQEGFEVLGSAWYDLTTISAYADAQKQTPGVLGMLATTWSGIDGYFQIPEHPGALVWAAEESWSNGRPFLCDYPCRPADVFYRLSHLAAPRIRSVLPLDLSKIAMTPRSGEESMFGRGRELDFSSLPMWIQWEDFRFELPQNTLILGGRGSQLPQQVEIAFQPEYADSIAFAHVTDLPARRALAFTTLDNKAFYDPGEIAVYTILYTDGDREEIPINYTREITDWNEPAGAAVAPIVWQGWSENGKMLQINGFRWDNPHPEKAIETIVFTAGKSPVSLAVFAVSLERKKIKER